MNTATEPTVTVKYHLSVYGITVSKVQVEGETIYSYYIRRPAPTPEGYIRETVRKRTFGKLFNTYEEARSFSSDRAKRDMEEAEKLFIKAREKWEKSKIKREPNDY